MKIKNVFLISIILLAIFSISAVSAENIAVDSVEISGDFNSNNNHLGDALVNHDLDDVMGMKQVKLLEIWGIMFLLLNLVI